MIWRVAIALALGVGLPAAAFEPALPDGAQAVATEPAESRIYALPTGAYEDGAVPVDRVPGEVRRRSWRIASGFDGTATLASRLASQLLKDDYDIVFSCDAAACGGFDFRFDVEVMLPPQMFVDLSDYVFLSALKSSDARLHAVGVMISRTAEAGMVQVIDVGPSKEILRGRPKLRPGSVPDQQTLPQASTGAYALETVGYKTLRDLEFETGSSQLGAGPFGSLSELATFLNADAGRRVALVGHTDAEGGLDVNIEISRKRAVAVMQRLIEAHGVAKEQLEAQGVGYLAPVASNQTDAGRTANRRVEVVLLNTE
ncbi:putative lipoprotein YiaD precursor [Shimia sp. SK013]|uniref:OmpA family protein n=1 Tax=Shimia sp. SK013 TaxID=1389006 RepID=UPI0006B4EA07|nr:OmpA family protein [Shimia sp. SK013]KPA21072.1 putative lipoprotein YiaD precursor [Shimia sp. SK013]